MSLAVPLMSRKVDLEWVGNLELLEVNDPPKPLPGATVRRVWTPDDRLVIQDAKSSDKICYYESIAAVRDRKTLVIYVVFRETIDALLAQQKDPELYPKWLMEHPVKGTERRFFLSRAVHNPKKLAATKGSDEMWLQEWLGSFSPAPLPCRRSF
jgi:hypothetical protein